MALNVWSVADLGAFYIKHRSELLAHANRVLKDSDKAEELVQDALIKFMLAAPEIESNEHAISYLHRTIENLCIDLFRLERRRPNLVVLDDAHVEVEALWQIPGDHSEAISQLEDAAIIRQALALLSPAERSALVMWEIEGRSTKEIATELGIKESAVRHTVSRARSSLRKVLSGLVVDEVRGLTALDMLSTTYKKASELAKKSSKVALSLFILMIAFLGFNSLTGTDFNTANVKINLTQEKSILNRSDISSPILVDDDFSSQKTIFDNSDVNFRVNKSIFTGLSKDGLPTGFSITDLAGEVGSIGLSSQSTISNPDGYILVSYVQSNGNDVINLLMSQSVTIDGAGTAFYASPSITVAGSWFPLTQSGSASTITRLSNGDYLLTASLYIDSTVDSALFVAPTGGLDVDVIPKEITTRIILDSDKRTILAQAIHIAANGVR